MTSFERDVLEGLSAKSKRLYSKYFYDDEGSHIFLEIMEMPEYYLTNAELEILKEQPVQITDACNFQEGFSIVELGAGDGAKTKELLRSIVKRDIPVNYLPVDISRRAMELLEEDLNKELPELEIHPLVGDYFHVLEALDLGDKPALFLFLGSNIGNSEAEDAVELLKHFGDFMRPGDKMLVGIDLKKNPFTILNAYNDKQGITRRFNMNLLTRINRELGANFDLDKFDFYPFYDAFNGDVRSSLVSLEDQVVDIPAIEKSIHFAKNELIYTELSKKYSLEEVEEMAEKCGFEFQQHFLDSRSYFVDSLWVKK